MDARHWIVYSIVGVKIKQTSIQVRHLTVSVKKSFGEIKAECGSLTELALYFNRPFMTIDDVLGSGQP